LVGLELVKYTICVEALSIIGSDHFPVEVILSLITGVMGKANIVKKINDDFEKNVYYKKPLKTEWSGEELELLGNELLRPEAIESLEIIYKSSMDVDTTLSELGSIIYNCAQKSERLNKKTNVNFFDNECKVMKNYLEDLRESVKNYSLYEGKSGT